ncbi:hypothetical protein RRG08_049066 [Elysia crispata]|uniref:Uncharacterized protein n=1 Tax=Elysia crispata TaxID=231223 RepID=A0AAE1DUW0_9GAST|nr:hypothetical protein RRG08_049066 [Elysia crispata]
MVTLLPPLKVTPWLDFPPSSQPRQALLYGLALDLESRTESTGGDSRDLEHCVACSVNLHIWGPASLHQSLHRDQANVFLSSLADKGPAHPTDQWYCVAVVGADGVEEQQPQHPFHTCQDKRSIRNEAAARTRGLFEVTLTSLTSRLLLDLLSRALTGPNCLTQRTWQHNSWRSELILGYVELLRKVGGTYLWKFGGDVGFSLVSVVLFHDMEFHVKRVFMFVNGPRIPSLEWEKLGEIPHAESRTSQHSMRVPRAESDTKLGLPWTMVSRGQTLRANNQDGTRGGGEGGKWRDGEEDDRSENVGNE